MNFGVAGYFIIIALASMLLKFSYQKFLRNQYYYVNSAVYVTLIWSGLPVLSPAGIVNTLTVLVFAFILVRLVSIVCRGFLVRWAY